MTVDRKATNSTPIGNAATPAARRTRGRQSLDMQFALKTGRTLAPYSVLDLQRLVGNRVTRSVLLDGRSAQWSGPSSRPDATSHAVCIGEALSDSESIRPIAVQRALDEKILAGYSRSRTSAGAIAQGVVAYNFNIRSKSPSVRLDELYALEHSVYAWFSEKQMKDYGTNETARRLKALLTAIQEEHQALVDMSLHDPQADPPVANFDDLGAKEQKQVRAIWTDLVSGSGNIRITEMQDYESTAGGGKKQVRHAGFRLQVLASFARLLTTAFGRQLVAEVNRGADGANLVTIEPGFAKAQGDIPASELVASAKDAEGASLVEFTEEDWLGKLKKGSRNWGKRLRQLKVLYPLVDLDPGLDEATRMEFMHRLRPVKVRGDRPSEGFSLKDGGQVRYYRFGGGSGSSITYPSDLRDGSDDPMSRYVDEAGNEIIVPVFIALGHELGHALHSLHGVSSGQAQSLEPIAGAGINPGEYSGTLEEIVTIRGVENRLRGEHGITRRHSHENVISLACKKIAEGPVDKAYKDSAKLPNKLKQPVQALLKEVDSLLGSRNIKEAERKLKIAQKALHEAQLQVQKPPTSQGPPQTESWLGGLIRSLIWD